MRDQGYGKFLGPSRFFRFNKSENKKISVPYPNVDAITGPTLSAAGFPYPEYFPVLFCLSFGIAIQILYDRAEARDGKGVPVMRSH